jgi:23S rRNA pseudouridine2605 synthase
MDVRLDRHQGANAWLTVGLREGKNREIRRAMAHIGLTVNRLIRISYGPFRLGELQPGGVEEVKPRILRDQLGLADEMEDTPKRTVAKPAPKGRATGAKAAAERPPRPGDGLRQLSEAWKKATRRPAPGKDAATPDTPAKGPAAAKRGGGPKTPAGTTPGGRAPRSRPSGRADSRRRPKREE